MSRFITDLITAEIKRLRPALRLPIAPWPETMSMDEEGLGIDSLDKLAVANIAASQLCFPETRAFDRFLQCRHFGEWIDAAEIGLADGGYSIAFYSSGTIGERKLVAHGLDALNQEIDALAEILGSARRIGFAVPSHHIYGFLFSILLPMRLSCLVVDLRGHSPASYAALGQGDLIIAFPSIWQAAAESITRWPQGLRGVTSTAPCPPETAFRLRAAGLERLIEVYGSTETAGIGWRDDAAQPFTFFPYWRRVAEDIIARSLPDRDVAHRLPDRPIWHGESRLCPAGRIDGQVQVGGINVSPEKARQLLVQHESVADADVRLMRSDEGNRLKAFVVPARLDLDAGELRQALTAWMQQHLTPPERPTSFTFGSRLPRNSLGKPADWMIDQ